MSDTAETTEGAETPAEKAKRSVREMATYAWVRVTDRAWEIASGPYGGIVEAEAWIKKHGEDGRDYVPLRGPDSALHVEPRKLVAVSLLVAERAPVPA